MASTLPTQEGSSKDTLSVVLFYRYCAIGVHTDDVYRWQLALCSRLGLVGRVLVSVQGINGTLAGTAAAIAEYKDNVVAYSIGHIVNEGNQSPEERRGEGSLSKQGQKQRPESEKESSLGGSNEAKQLFAGIEWKDSSCLMGAEPFPDLNVKQCAELVATGGTMPYDLAQTGTHLSPSQFHDMLHAGGDDLVVLDVRNRWEHALGHFEDGDGRPAQHPNMRNFTQFADYVQQARESLRGKRVLMYCTGGIRCESASAHLCAAGIADGVYQLSGGIHRYCQQYGAHSDCLFKGRNFVFDRRVSLAPADEGRAHHGNAKAGVEAMEQARAVIETDDELSSTEITHASGVDVVGRCCECGKPCEQFCGGAVCTVCVCLVLVCADCRTHGIAMTAIGRETASESQSSRSSVDAKQLQSSSPVPMRRYEWFCEEHERLKGAFFTFLEDFPLEHLMQQITALKTLRAEFGHGTDFTDDPRQRRRTLDKQIKRVQARIDSLAEGRAVVNSVQVRRCRSCRKIGCPGNCWGFWKEETKRDTNPHAVFKAIM